MAGWDARLRRRLSARFRGQSEILDSDVSLQATSLTEWLLNSEGTAVQTGRELRTGLRRAPARAQPTTAWSWSVSRGFDAEAMGDLGGDGQMESAADAIIADLEALRRAPLAEPYAGPAILEGKAAGVFFHEIFGHRVEGHRQKNEEEGQTFAKKVGQPIMPAFISVFDDPTLSRLDGVDLNGFYRFDDEGVEARRAPLVDGGILRGFLLSRSPTRGFFESNGHGRRQEGRAVVSRQGNLVVEPSLAVPPAELRRLLREEARRQGKPYGLSFRDISGGLTQHGARGAAAFKVLPILVYRVWVDGRPDELVRGVDLVGTPLSALSKIIAASNTTTRPSTATAARSRGSSRVSATSPELAGAADRGRAPRQGGTTSRRCCRPQRWQPAPPQWKGATP